MVIVACRALEFLQLYNSNLCSAQVAHVNATPLPNTKNICWKYKNNLLLFSTKYPFNRLGQTILFAVLSQFM